MMTAQQRRRVQSFIIALLLYLCCILPAATIWSKPLLLAAVYAAFIGGAFTIWHRRTDVVYFAVPFVVGPLGELIAIGGGAWSYTESSLPFPIWLPLGWGFAGVCIHRILCSIDAAGGPPPQSVRSRPSAVLQRGVIQIFAIALLLFLSDFLLAATLWSKPLLLAAVYVVLTMGALTLWHRRADIVYYAVPFVIGPFGELVAIRGGAWSYTDAGLMFPIWLPVAWGLAGICIRRISHSIDLLLG